MDNVLNVAVKKWILTASETVAAASLKTQLKATKMKHSHCMKIVLFDLGTDVSIHLYTKELEYIVMYLSNANKTPAMPASRPVCGGGSS